MNKKNLNSFIEYLRKVPAWRIDLNVISFANIDMGISVDRFGIPIINTHGTCITNLYGHMFLMGTNPETPFTIYTDSFQYGVALLDLTLRQQMKLNNPVQSYPLNIGLVEAEGMYYESVTKGDILKLLYILLDTGEVVWPGKVIEGCYFGPEIKDHVYFPKDKLGKSWQKRTSGMKIETVETKIEPLDHEELA